MTQASGELALIERIRSRWGASGREFGKRVALGIGDDCAILRPPAGHEVLVTTDFTLENRHFHRDWHPAQSVGHRALARGLSDLAAMGAEPMAAFLSLALPPEMVKKAAGRRWVDGFFEGLSALAERFKAPLAGGDTSESPDALVLADIVLVGTAPVGRSLRRRGARAGDLLYVTGALGGSAAELEAMRLGGRRLRRTGAAGMHPQMFPEPRLKVGQALLRRGIAPSAIDLSDGLSTDAMHLCQESKVGMEIEADRLPIHPLAKSWDAEKALKLALHGGEDYELLFTARLGTKVPKRIAGVPVTRIGQVTRGEALQLVRLDGQREQLKPGGWEHFSGK